MIKLAYFDCPTGIAGDMCLGALVDAGVPLEYLTNQLKQLKISNEYTLRAKSVQRNGQRATQVSVDLTSDLAPTQHCSTNPTATIATHADKTLKMSGSPAHTHPSVTRHLPDIETIIQSSQLSSRTIKWSLAIFRQLATAEGAVHGIPFDQVHFHEVGATDAIVDIVGTCIGLDWLQIDYLYCSALPTGGGTIRTAHGCLPVPAPAVLQLLQMGQVPIYSNGIERELVTPTGAAIATTLSTAFGPPPTMTLHTVGLGAGRRDLAIPNILRVWIGESTHTHSHDSQHRQALQSHRSDSTTQIETAHVSSKAYLHFHSPISPKPSLSTHQHLEDELPDDSPSTHQPLENRQSSNLASSGPDSTAQSSHHHSQFQTQTIAVLETQLDDITPQIIGYLFDCLFAAGALDLFTQGIGMKKSRPGLLLTVICLPDAIDICEHIIYQETTTLGIRRRRQARSLLYREFHTVHTEYGPVSIKAASMKEGSPWLNVKPEYEDCARLAQQHHVALHEVYQAALIGWYTSAHNTLPNRPVSLNHI